MPVASYALAESPCRHFVAIVVSVDDLLVGADHELIVVIPLSSSLAHSALRPRLGPEAGIDDDSVAIPRAVRGIVRRRLLRRLGEVSTETLAEVEAALGTVLGQLDDDPSGPRARRPATRSLDWLSRVSGGANWTRSGRSGTM